MLVITEAILSLAEVTIGMYSGSESAHATKVVIIKKKDGSDMTNETSGISNMTK